MEAQESHPERSLPITVRAIPRGWRNPNNGELALVLLRFRFEPLCLTLEIPRRQLTAMVAPVVSLAQDSSRQDTRHGWQEIDRCILCRNRSGVPESACESCQ